MASKDVGETPGWKSPLPVGSAPGDTFDAPPAPYPAGPVPDPIGNMAHRPGKPTDMPTR